MEAAAAKKKRLYGGAADSKRVCETCHRTFTIHGSSAEGTPSAFCSELCENTRVESALELLEEPQVLFEAVRRAMSCGLSI